jgi:hypothetical protein
MAYDVTQLPSGCKPQTTGLREFQSVAELPPADVVACFRANAEAANRVLGQSYDMRYSPSTFVEEADGGHRVGWFDGSRQHVQRFTDFSEAVADYLLFSFGKGRLRC